MVPGQEANSDNLGKGIGFDFLHNNCMLNVLIRLPRQGDSNDYIQHTIILWRYCTIIVEVILVTTFNIQLLYGDIV